MFRSKFSIKQPRRCKTRVLFDSSVLLINTQQGFISAISFDSHISCYVPKAYHTLNTCFREEGGMKNIEKDYLQGLKRQNKLLAMYV